MNRSLGNKRFDDIEQETGVPKGALEMSETRPGRLVVQNPVQRLILECLLAGDMELQDLVRATGKTKSTLSSLHMRALIDRDLVEQIAHPHDGRRRIYRLSARDARATGPPARSVAGPFPRLAARNGAWFSLKSTLRCLMAAPPDASCETIWAQAIALGGDLRLPGAQSAGFWMRFVTLLEQERIARALRINLQTHEVELEPILDGAPARLAAALAGLAHGSLHRTGTLAGSVVARTRHGVITLQVV